MAGGSVPLQSDWTGLSDQLIASFFPLKSTLVQKADGTKSYIWDRDMSQPEVRAPITDGMVDTSVNWHSAFEGVGADQKWSAVSALLQTGALKPIAEQLDKIFGGQYAESFTSSFEGKTSVTKLNSTQVFTGLPPTKVTVTALFRAFSDPSREVAAPVNQLMQWALPQFLATDGTILEAAKGNVQGFYPSRIPQIIGMKYAGSSYLPLVIEHAPSVITGPRDSKGRLLASSLTLSLSSLSSLDANDWRSGWATQ